VGERKENVSNPVYPVGGGVFTKPLRGIDKIIFLTYASGPKNHCLQFFVNKKEQFCDMLGS